MPCNRAFTATTMKEMVNMMWAMITVGMPSGKRRFKKSASRLEPMTTSGVAIGKKMSRFVLCRPRKR